MSKIEFSGENAERRYREFLSKYNPVILGLFKADQRILLFFEV